MMLRNLKALSDLQRAPAPSVAIGTVQQVNVASQQVNVTRKTTEHADATIPATSTAGRIASE
jgi:hypothetical protein